ncbi:MAG: NAD-dependent epimerase/dehydratase family protein [Acidimicrobiia bacterium]
MPDESPRSVTHAAASPVAVVTGASGWLGTNLVRELVGTRDRVRCLVHSADEAPLLELLSPNIEIIVGDVRDPVAADRLFDGIDAASVFHVAAVIHPTKRAREFFDVNVGGTEMIIDRARRARTTRFVHVSSNSPFGANASPDEKFTEDSPYHPYMGYGSSKLEAEQVVQRSNDRGDVETVIVRAPWFYGPFQPARQTQWFAAVRRGRFPLVGPGTQRRSMAFTGNLVSGLLLAETATAAAGRAYWIADAEPYELAEILEQVRAALAAEGLQVSGGRPKLPALAGVVAASLDGFLQSRGRYVQALHVLGELKDTIACDITRARVELGYEPATSLYEGMRASVRWCLERGLPI